MSEIKEQPKQEVKEQKIKLSPRDILLKERQVRHFEVQSDVTKLSIDELTKSLEADIPMRKAKIEYDELAEQLDNLKEKKEKNESENIQLIETENSLISLKYIIDKELPKKRILININQLKDNLSRIEDNIKVLKKQLREWR